jgi:hypothetical protein
MLIESLFTSFCLTVAGTNYNDPCSKAFDAGTRQVQLRQRFDGIEDDLSKYTLDYALSNTEKATGKQGLSILGAGFFLAKTARERKLDFLLPNLGICQSLRGEIAPDSSGIKLEWRF